MKRRQSPAPRPLPWLLCQICAQHSPQPGATICRHCAEVVR